MKNIKSIALLLVCLISCPAFAITRKERLRSVYQDTHVLASKYKHEIAAGGVIAGVLGLGLSLVCILTAGNNKKAKTGKDISDIVSSVQSQQNTQQADAEFGSLDTLDSKQPGQKTEPQPQVLTLLQLQTQAAELTSDYSKMTPDNCDIYQEQYAVLRGHLNDALNESWRMNNGHPAQELLDLKKEISIERIYAYYTYVALKTSNIDVNAIISKICEEDMDNMINLERYDIFIQAYTRLQAESALFSQAYDQCKPALNELKQLLEQLANAIDKKSSQSDVNTNSGSLPNLSQQSNSETQLVSAQRIESAEPAKHETSGGQTTVEANNANAEPSVGDSIKKDKSDAMVPTQDQRQQPSVTEQAAALLDQARKIKSNNDIIECGTQLTKLTNAMNQLSISNKEKQQMLAPIRDMMEVASINYLLPSKIAKEVQKGKDSNEIIQDKIKKEIKKCKTIEGLKRLQTVYGLVTFEPFKLMLTQGWVIESIQSKEREIERKANKSREGDLDKSYDHLVVPVDSQEQEAEPERVSNVQPKQQTLTPELQQKKDDICTALSKCKRGDTGAAAIHMRASVLLNEFKDACRQANIDQLIIDPIEVAVRVKYWEVSYLPAVVEPIMMQSHDRKANRNDLHKKIKEQIARELEYMRDGFDKNLLLQAYQNLNHQLLNEELQENDIATLFA